MAVADYENLKKKKTFFMNFPHRPVTSWSPRYFFWTDISTEKVHYDVTGRWENLVEKRFLEVL